MKITGFGSIGKAGGSKKTTKSSAVQSFAELLAASEAGAATEAAPASDITATAAVSNMLALQEISDEEVRRGKLAQQGHNLLDSLEKLRRQLLTGSLPLSVLQEMNRNLVLKKQVVNDPRLTAIIEDIELRAAVEMAKLETAIRSQVEE